MRWLFPLFTGLFTALLFTACSTTELPPLPEPATNNGLANAEKDLDKATAERLSKVAASVGISYVLAEKNPQSTNNDVLKSELKLAKTLVGRATDTDWSVTKARVESVMGGKPLADAYKEEQQAATALRLKLKEADEKYEAEKAKKQAEYEAKLKEREQALEQEKALRKIDADEARKDKFIYLGGLICLLGLAVFVWGPKKDGILILAGGFALSSFGYVMGTPYFYYVLGGVGALVVIKVALILFKDSTEAPKSLPEATQGEDQPK